MSTTKRAYPIAELPDRNIDDHYEGTAGATATSIAISPQSKGLYIANESANPARVRLDGRTATATAGILIAANTAIFFEHFRTESISIIRTAGADATIRVAVLR